MLFQICQVHSTLYLYTTSDSKASLISSIISGFIYIFTLYFMVKKYNELGAAYSFIIANISRIILQIIFSIHSWEIFKMKIYNHEHEIKKI